MALVWRGAGGSKFKNKSAMIGSAAYIFSVAFGTFFFILSQSGRAIMRSCVQFGGRPANQSAALWLGLILTPRRTASSKQ